MQQAWFPESGGIVDKDALKRLSSEELLTLHRGERNDQDSHWNAIWVLRDRGGETELEMGLRLAASEDAVDREIAADLLGQLGSRNASFISETVATLIDLLDDPSVDVLEGAIINLGHRRDTRAVGTVVRFAGHPNPDIRYAVAFALGGMDDPRAEGRSSGLPATPTSTRAIGRSEVKSPGR